MRLVSRFTAAAPQCQLVNLYEFPINCGYDLLSMASPIRFLFFTRDPKRVMFIKNDSLFVLEFWAQGTRNRIL